MYDTVNYSSKGELGQKDQRTMELVKMHKALLPRDDKDRFYKSRKDGERGLYKKSQKRLITAASNSNISTNELGINS